VERLNLKAIAPFICVGLMTDRIPATRPPVDSNASIHHLVGFGHDSKATNVTWLQFANDNDLEGWFNEIVKTLPKQNPTAPPNAPNVQQPNVPPPATAVSGNAGFGKLY
jgi:hypothetical protein